MAASAEMPKRIKSSDKESLTFEMFADFQPKQKKLIQSQTSRGNNTASVCIRGRIFKATWIFQVMLLYRDLAATQVSEQETSVTKSNKSNELSGTDVYIMSLETVTLSHITLTLDQKMTAQDVL